MERTRSNRITARSPSTHAGPGTSTYDEGFHNAKVMMLGRYARRHVVAESADRSASATREATAGEATADRAEAPRAGRDLRAAAPAPRQNHLLGALNDEDYARLLRHLEFVSLPCGKVLGEAGSIPEYVYFPTAGIVSMLYEMKNGTSVEAAVTGHDGVVGVTVFMGGGATTNRAVVRNSGHGYRMRADILKREFEESPTLRQPLLRYTQALLIQMAQSGICHGHHQLVEQFCRLLLSSMDRLASSDVALTQDTIANLLGVRRESITAAAGKLQAAGLIQYRRGRITVLDRAALESRVCECYATVKAELDRLVPHCAPPAILRATLRRPPAEPDEALVATAHAAERLRSTLHANHSNRAL
jgi:CRP-like cAMP-binding protein